MGTYSYDEHVAMFGGIPEPGETYPGDPDALLDARRECGCHDGVTYDGYGLNIRDCPTCTETQR
jgi:hypothetical protein